MDLEYYNEIYFGKDYKKLYDELHSKILDVLKNSKEEFSFRYIGASIDDLLAKKNDPNYVKKDLLTVEGNEITSSLLTEELVNDIINNLNKNVKKVGLPVRFMEDHVDFLSKLRSSELKVTGYRNLTEELLKQIHEKTQIKKVFTNSKYSISDIESELFAIETTTNTSVYDDISIMPPETDEINDEIELVNKNLDNKLLKRLYESLNLSKLPSKIKIARKKYDYLYSIIIDGNNVTIRVSDSTLDNVEGLCNFFTKSGYKVGKLVMDVRDVNNLYSNDYSFLDKLQKSTEIVIDNGHVDDLTYEEFQSQIEGIKWYKEMIKQSDLSPLEKLIFAYDIMKTFPYREKEAHSADSRNPGKILNDRYIVCSGYTAMLDEILKGMDSNIRHTDVGVTCFDDKGEYRGAHSRSLVDIADEKYGIHGSFFLDSTWDSVSDRKQEYYGHDYIALDLYRYFLVPYSEYKEVFPNDSLPYVFKNKELNESFSSDALNKEIERIKEKVRENEEEQKKSKFVSKINPQSELIGYFNSKMYSDKTLDQINDGFNQPRISYDKLLEAIKSVRLAEGYTKENVDAEIERISRINKEYFRDGHEMISENMKKRD